VKPPKEGVSWKEMELLDCFYQRDLPVIDRLTFVYDEQDPRTGYYTMLSTSATGAAFSQSTDGSYEPGGMNLNLGQRVDFQSVGSLLVAHVLGRMEE
jgi:hypothetical protein